MESMGSGSDFKNQYSFSLLRYFPQLNITFKTPLHSKSYIDAHHSFVSSAASELNALDRGTDKEDLIDELKSREKYEITKRVKPFPRFFYDVDNAPKLQEGRINKEFKCLRTRMVCYDEKNEELLFSNLPCTCSFCIAGNFQECLNLVRREFMRKKIVLTSNTSQNEPSKKVSTTSSNIDHTRTPFQNITNTLFAKKRKRDTSSENTSGKRSKNEENENTFETIIIDSSSSNTPLVEIPSPENKYLQVNTIQMTDYNQDEEVNKFIQRLGDEYPKRKINFLQDSSYHLDTVGRILNSIRATDDYINSKTIIIGPSKMIRILQLIESNEKEAKKLIGQEKNNRPECETLILSVFIDWQMVEESSFFAFSQNDDNIGHFITLHMDLNSQTIVLLDHIPSYHQFYWFLFGPAFEKLFSLVFGCNSKRNITTNLCPQGALDCGVLTCLNVEGFLRFGPSFAEYYYFTREQITKMRNYHSYFWHTNTYQRLLNFEWR